MSEYLSLLSPQQREAVENYKGASLVIAGAGAGKTRVLTYRIAHMIAEGVDPNSILSLTFTKKAANEMRSRISSIISYSEARQIWMGTFHSVFARILRLEAEAIKFPNTFTIYETADSRNVVKSIVKELNLDENKYKPKDIFARISMAKNSLVTPAMYRDNTSLVSEDRERGILRFAEVYSAYMQRCRLNSAMDFDDLLLYTNILFKEHPDILEKYQDMFRYILVDEYQDTNSAQYLIIKKLSAKYRNICAVGDDAQSIYSFRGARIENILRFQNDYQDAQLYKLEENYRSTQTIVNAANSVIEKNKNQITKKVFSNKEVGEKILLCRTNSDKDEAREVVRDIMHSHNDGVLFKEMAILYRTNAQSRAMEDALRMRAIPYRIYGGISFYQRAEVKNIVAYVRLVVNKNDDEALKRIINFPARGIGATTLSHIEACAQAVGKSMWSVMESSTPEEMGLRDAAVRKLNGFMQLIRDMREVAEDADAYEFVFALCQKSGIITTYKDNPAPESQTAYQNVEELVNSVKQQCETSIKESGDKLLADKWVEDITLLSDMDRDENSDDQVTLMTIHSAKGLEYGNIYLVGVEDGLFPSSQCTDNPSEMEEERRLFYVAITRAAKRLMISFSLSRFKWGSITPSRPSPLLRDIDPQYYDNPDLINTESAGGVYGGEPIKATWGRQQMEMPSVEKPRAASTFKRVAASTSTSPIASHGDISVGTRVHHAKFGNGVVESMEKLGNDVKALINFDKNGKKNMLLNFARLEKL